MKKLSITEGKTKNAPKTRIVKTAPPPAPKPKKSKAAPKYDNGGRAFLLIQEREGDITNTQAHGSSIDLVKILANSLHGDKELKTIVRMALAVVSAM